MTKFFRTRDLIISILAIFALYQTWNENSHLEFSLETKWFVQNDIPHNHLISVSSVYDINNDGFDELVTVENNKELKIYDINPEHLSFTDSYFHPEEIVTYQFPSTKIPHTVGTGCGKISSVDIEEHSTLCDNIIVTLFEDLSISAFDNDLNKLWEINSLFISENNKFDLAYKFPTYDTKCPHTSSILVDGVPGLIGREGQGMIFLTVDFHSDSTLNCHEELRVYAIHAWVGEIHWIYSSRSTFFLNEEEKDHVITNSLHNYFPSTSLNSQITQNLLDSTLEFTQKHYSNDWNDFKESIIKELPHKWSPENPHYSLSMSLSKFERSKTFNFKSQTDKFRVKEVTNIVNDKKLSSSKKISALNKVFNTKNLLKSSISYNNDLLKSKLNSTINSLHSIEKKHRKMALLSGTRPSNVLSVNHKNGFVSLALNSGDVVASLPLDPNKFYFDINNDGIIDTLEIKVKHNNNELDECILTILSGIPPHSLLFNTTQICQYSMKSSSHDYKSFAKLKNSRHVNLGPVEFAIPLFIPPLSEESLKESSISSTNTQKKSPSLIIANSHGIVSAFSNKFELLWQSLDGPTWSTLGSKNYRPVLQYYYAYSPEAEHILGLSNKLISTSSTSHIIKNNKRNYEDNIIKEELEGILIYGNKNILLYSLKGSILVKKEFENFPYDISSSSIIVDIDNDGINDFIFFYNNSIILGLKVVLSTSVSFLYYPLLFLSILSLLVLISRIRGIYIQQINPAIGNKFNKSVKTFLRSTDREHFD